MAGYLFTHFIGEQKDGEQIYFSMSRDGLHYQDLNQGRPVLMSKIGEAGARDPFPIRHEKTGRFYIIATDLRIEAGKGWKVAQEEGSRNLLVWESEDLIHWSEVRSVEVGVEGAGCVWAPEAIYDKKKEAYLVFWASKIKLPGEDKAKHRIYASYTKDFREFEKPFVYIEREKDVIDTTIISVGEKYYRFSKNEVTSRVNLDVCGELTGEFTPIKVKVLDELEGVEGPECYLLPDGKTWCLIVDQFATHGGYLPLLTTDMEGGDFRILERAEYSMGLNVKRHGGILPLTDNEYERLLNI